jgi:hypothetical protein
MKLINNVLFLFVLVSLVNSISCQGPTERVTGFAVTQQYVPDNNQSTPGLDAITQKHQDDLNNDDENTDD